MNPPGFFARQIAILATALCSVSLASASRAQDADTKLSFNRDIRPILSDKCFACHGPDKVTREADLRLDTPAGATFDLGGYAAVVPGDPKKSELVLRIRSSDPDEVMPPPKHRKKLSEAERNLLERWIAQGAEYEGHWAYVAPVRPTVPALRELGSQPRGNPIDVFVQARLEREKLKPSPATDRRTLIRRVSFDLVGLPPRPEEVEAFVADRDPRAYEKLLDRLLASPHFGERMAVHWLDLVRYADTVGYHGDQSRNVSPFRDYVIRAFNDNMPFDRFTTEQLAGDLLPNATLWQKVASGYNRLLQTTAEGGAQAKEYEAIYFADRVRNFSIVWLASTIGCAQCHDHKFDPFTTRDFYSLASFFADIQQKGVMTPEPGILVPIAEQEQRKGELEGKLAALRKTLDTTTPELAAAQAEWEKSFDAARFPAWKPLTIVSAAPSNRAVPGLQPGSSPPAKTEERPSGEYTITAKTDLQRTAGFRIELLADPSSPKAAPGRGAGAVVVTDFDISVSTGAAGKPVKVQLEEPTASFAVPDPGNPVRLWQAMTLEKKGGKKFRFPAKDDKAARENHLVVAAKKPLTVTPETTLTFTIRHDGGDGVRFVDRVRVSAIGDEKPKATVGFAPEDIAQLLAQEPARRAPAHVAALAAHFRAIAPQLDSARQELASTQSLYDRLLAEIPKTLVTATETPAVLKIKARGNWMDESGEPVSPAVPKSFPALQSAAGRPSRLDLARWLVAPENPLTARVFANRLWKLYFGQGLAKTLEDLGSQGEAPSHPELLDWLAVEFRESGWDVKHLVRLMVSSATYRQTSVASPELRDRDPYNQLLARQGRFRLDAELVRDNALAISGLLAAKLGGTSTRPYQPEGYWAYLNFPPRPYEQDHGERLYRRSVYMWWQRTFLHPALLAFDASTREECVAERARSNTPQQALVLMNDPIYVEAARVFAERIVREGGAEPEGRVRWAFTRALSRPPDIEEIDALLKLYRSQFAHYQQATEAARQLATVGEWPPPKQTDMAEVAAWSAVSRVLLNLHETITRN